MLGKNDACKFNWKKNSWLALGHERAAMRTYGEWWVDYLRIVWVGAVIEKTSVAMYHTVFGLKPRPLLTTLSKLYTYIAPVRPAV